MNKEKMRLMNIEKMKNERMNEEAKKMKC